MVRDTVQKRLGDKYADLADDVFDRMLLIKIINPAVRYFILEATFRLGYQSVAKILEKIKTKYFYKIKTKTLPQKEVEYAYIVLNSLKPSAALLLLLLTFMAKAGRANWIPDLAEFCVNSFKVLDN
jgi:hypothetical protein